MFFFFSRRQLSSTFCFHFVVSILLFVKPKCDNQKHLQLSKVSFDLDRLFIATTLLSCHPTQLNTTLKSCATLLTQLSLSVAVVIDYRHTHIHIPTHTTTCARTAIHPSQRCDSASRRSCLSIDYYRYISFAIYVRPLAVSLFLLPALRSCSIKQNNFRQC